MSGVSSTPRSWKTSRSTSPVDDASGTIRLTSPKRVLSWWWSTSITSGASWRISGSGPSRLSFAQSTATRTRSAASSGSVRRSSSSSIHEYSPGIGAEPERNMTASLPSRSSASFVASSEPSASPSGFSCVVTRKRSCARSASTTARRSSAVVWSELIDQSGHADPALDRRIVLERQLRGPFHSQLPAEPRLEDAVRGSEPVETRLALSLRPEDAHEHARVAEVRRRLHAGDRDEADPRVLELADSLG